MSDETGDTSNGGERQAEPAPTPSAGPVSQSGLTPNMAAMLSYLFWFFSGVIFLAIEKDDRFVRFHAMQSTLTFGGLFVLNIVLAMIPFVGWLLLLLVWPAAVILWIVLMVKAYQNEMFKLPVIGDLAERNI